MKPTKALAFLETEERGYDLLGIIHGGEVLTMRSLQRELRRLREVLPFAQLYAHSPKGLAFAVPIFGSTRPEDRQVFTDFEFDFAANCDGPDNPNEKPDVLYITSPERSNLCGSSADACRVVLDPDKPVTAGTLKAFIDGLDVSVIFDDDGPYLALHDNSGAHDSKLRYRAAQEHMQPRYQPCSLRLIAERVQGSIHGIRAEVTAAGATFTLREGQKLHGFTRLAANGATAFAWIKTDRERLLADFMGVGDFWRRAVNFAKALGYHPENLDELLLAIDDQRSLRYDLGAISDY